MRRFLAIAVPSLALGVLLTAVLITTGGLDPLVASRLRAALAKGEAAAVFADQVDEDLSVARFRLLARDKWMEWDNDWMGVKMEQYPSDLMIYQRLVHEVRPEVIVETGTHYGGSALFFAQLLQSLRPEGRVITVDIEDRGWNQTVAARGEELRPLFERIDFIHGSSTAPETIDRIRTSVAGKTVLVMLDALHLKEHVAAELPLYAPLVTKGSYLIVNDTYLDESQWTKRGPGPNEALQEFLGHHSDFQVDRARNRYKLSCAPGGFLKRIR